MLPRCIVHTSAMTWKKKILFYDKVTEVHSTYNSWGIIPFFIRHGRIWVYPVIDNLKGGQSNSFHWPKIRFPEPPCLQGKDEMHFQTLLTPQTWCLIISFCLSYAICSMLLRNQLEIKLGGKFTGTRDVSTEAGVLKLKKLLGKKNELKL